MKLLSLLTLALILALPINAQAQNQTNLTDMPAGAYELDPTHASLTWKVSHLGLSNYTARFTDFDATLQFNPEDPESSTLTASVNPLSVKTDYPTPEKKDFDKKLATGETWFNGTAFPQITFASTSFVKTGDDTGQLTGDLTFLGVTKPLVFDVRLNGATKVQPFSQKPTLGFSATAKMDRSEWGFDTYEPQIGETVEIIIEAELALNKVAANSSGNE